MFQCLFSFIFSHLFTTFCRMSDNFGENTSQFTSSFFVASNWSLTHPQNFIFLQICFLFLEAFLPTIFFPFPIVCFWILGFILNILYFNHFMQLWNISNMWNICSFCGSKSVISYLYLLMVTLMILAILFVSWLLDLKWAEPFRTNTFIKANVDPFS